MENRHKKTEFSLCLLSTILICSLFLIACSEPGIEVDSVTDISSTTTMETTAIETTSASAMVKNEKASEKETTSAQPNDQITQADIETEELEYYADNDDSYYEEDYAQSEYEEPEQEYEQNDDWEEDSASPEALTDEENLDEEAMNAETAQDDQSYAEPAPGKDHDSYQPPWPDYDPMLFNDKERSRYESCDHEWVTVVWPVPGATEHIECSKCGVMLNQWIYNGYSE